MHCTDRQLLWILIGVAAAMVCVLVRVAGLTVGVDRSADVVLCSSTALACLLYRPAPGSWQRRLLDGLEGLAAFALICGLGTIASYAIAALTRGYVDDPLAAIDRAMGFDWLTLYRFTASSNVIRAVSRSAYFVIFVAPTLLLTALAWTGRAAAMRRFLLAYGIALAITLAIFAFCPARSALLHYVGAHPGYMPVTGLQHATIIEELRNGTLDRVGIGSLTGLVAFPSFHAASAFLFIWGSWPVRRLRLPMLVANLAMLAATPIEGSHYLIDLFGGAAVALAAVAAVRRYGRAPTPDAAIAAAPSFAPVRPLLSPP